MIYQERVRIKQNVEIARNIYKLELDRPLWLEKVEPGQFVNVKVAKGYEPLLRRPFSIVAKNHDSFTLIYDVVGKGTQLLKEYKSSETIDLIGPLGNGFKLTDGVVGKFTVEGKSVVLVGGGIGAAGLLLLAYKLRGKFANIKGLYILLGAKSKERLILKEEFSLLGKVHIATEDGSEGYHGTVVELFSNMCRSLGDFVVFGCGPLKMLEKVVLICNNLSVWCQVSLSIKLCCGMGLCFGCVIPTKRGRQRVCKEGPVFFGDEIEWPALLSEYQVW